MDDQRIELFDTTLRDGTQGEGVNLSLHDKLMITQKLDDFGIDIIEGGWPGSNPKDAEYFQAVRKLSLNHARVCAFGSTARFPDKVKSDHNLNMLLQAESPCISIFGKTWKFHSQRSLDLTDEQNEELIFKSVDFLKSEGRIIIFDAEHFFDGYKDDPVFAIKMLKAAERAGADILALCDTNGGSLPDEVSRIVRHVRQEIKTPVGIHAHNDGDLAVANSLVAVQEGAVHVQGTINGFGERCGNANLCSIIPNLIIKMNRQLKGPVQLENLTSLSRYVYEIANIVPNTRAAFVGKSAFTHKGGIHVSSVLKDSRMYEHIDPALTGNTQHVLISDLSGQSNIRYKARELGIELPDTKEFNKHFVQRIKSLEFEGFQFDGAEASFELLLRSELKDYEPFFKITYAKVNVLQDDEGQEYSEAVLKVQVGDEEEHTASDGNGPVNALDNALRKALRRFYPEISSLHLIDYKVRVLGEKDGTGAKVRVLVETADEYSSWSTVGVSTNIIKASIQALSDSINFKIMQNTKHPREVSVI
ncbi:MAG: citramalate synthase [Calditrichaceae bacterium]|nr:citramalate synthase [Calditrichaceae bacterium]MBN2710551.1 citramalate synthase [Calditrichaceae bacterium]RQV96535.1 MAG: citramalate synthase [Calditrichota bacterium]